MAAPAINIENTPQKMFFLGWLNFRMVRGASSAEFLLSLAIIVAFGAILYFIADRVDRRKNSERSKDSPP